MEKEEFTALLKSGMEKLNIEITKNQTNQFHQYMEILIEWNKKMNLTAITEPKEIIIKHFIDSATILKYIKNEKNMIDIGTGAGFPGIPIKILKPEMEIILLDSLNKRIKFLEEVIKSLQLTKIKAIHARAEEAGQKKEYRENFDIAVSRAVANTSVLAEYTIPFVKINGKAIYMKGSEIEEELKEGKKAINILGGKIEKIETFKLPNTEMGRNNIIIHKECKTSGKFPRKPGTARKEPIK